MHRVTQINTIELFSYLIIAYIQVITVYAPGE